MVSRMKTKPVYRTPQTFRNFENYQSAVAYTKGWNDAMDFIFPDEKKRREKEAMKKMIKIVRKGGESK